MLNFYLDFYRDPQEIDLIVVSQWLLSIKLHRTSISFVKKAQPFSEQACIEYLGQRPFQILENKFILFTGWLEEKKMDFSYSEVHRDYLTEVEDWKFTYKCLGRLQTVTHCLTEPIFWDFVFEKSWEIMK